MRNLLANSFKICLFVFVILGSTKANAQFNCPDSKRCTSKDLEIVGAFLTGGQCFCSATGTQTATLNMTINNTTGSWRTSFAFFGTLVKTNPDGTTQTSPLSGCGGPLPPNTPTSIVVNNSITYNCNQTLSLTNVFLAWTDAADAQTPTGPATRCAEILADACAKIAPKCGTAPVVPIAPLLSASSTTTAGCTGASAGKIKINPIGGVSPYTVVLKKGTATVATQNNVTSSGYEFTGLVEGTDYTAVVTDSRTPTACSYTTGAITLGSVFCCVRPTVTDHPDNQTTCAGGSAAFTVASTGGDPAPTIVWQILVGATWTDLTIAAPYSVNVDGTTLTVDPAAIGLNGKQYRAVLTSGTCTPVNSDAATLTVNAVPDAASTIYHPPACDKTTFSVEVTNVVDGATYIITKGDGGTLAGVATPSNEIVASGTGNITFSGIPAGSGFQVSVSKAGCSPAGGALSCTSATVGTPATARINTTNTTIEFREESQSPTSVKAYPNPFSDRVKFVVTSSVGGNGVLDVYNMSGQKVKTVHQGYIPAGTQTFELSLPTQQVANLVYVLRIGDKRMSGKILQINR